MAWGRNDWQTMLQGLQRSRGGRDGANKPGPPQTQEQEPTARNLIDAGLNMAGILGLGTPLGFATTVPGMAHAIATNTPSFGLADAALAGLGTDVGQVLGFNSGGWGRRGRYGRQSVPGGYGMNAIGSNLSTSPDFGIAGGPFGNYGSGKGGKKGGVGNSGNPGGGVGSSSGTGGL